MGYVQVGQAGKTMHVQVEQMTSACGMAGLDLTPSVQREEALNRWDG